MLPVTKHCFDLRSCARVLQVQLQNSFFTYRDSERLTSQIVSPGLSSLTITQVLLIGKCNVLQQVCSWNYQSRKKKKLGATWLIDLLTIYRGKHCTLQLIGMGRRTFLDIIYAPFYPRMVVNEEVAS